MYEQRVADALDRLRGRYESVSTRTKRWPLDDAAYRATRDRAERGTVGGAGAWVTRETAAGREALVVREEGADGWSEPAGKQEPGETLEATAHREVREETGVEIEIEGVVLATRAIHTCGDRRPLARLVVVFDASPAGVEVCGEGSADALDPREGEIAAARWVGDHPEELAYPTVADYPL
ncbi:MAG: NUDIX domain-containing protein [Halobaculum sp.]